VDHDFGCAFQTADHKLTLDRAELSTVRVDPHELLREDIGPPISQLVISGYRIQTALKAALRGLVFSNSSISGSVYFAFAYATARKYAMCPNSIARR
jgi:hypothetical protein